jgi:hypothetical protein
VLANAAQTLGVDLEPAPPTALVENAAELPCQLSRAESIVTLEVAEAYPAAALPYLYAVDRGQRSSGTHHGEMALSGWLLLIVIHDDDHLRQLLARQVES